MAAINHGTIMKRASFLIRHSSTFAFVDFGFWSTNYSNSGAFASSGVNRLCFSHSSTGSSHINTNFAHDTIQRP
jgi:hypothetical protein